MNLIRTTLLILVTSLAPVGLSAPANDAFAGRSALTGASVTANGSNVGASRQPGEPWHNDDGSGRSVWWSWTAPADGNVTISTAGSGFDTVLAVYEGATLSSLVLVAKDDDGGTGTTSLVSFAVLAGGVYVIAVDGYSDGTVVEVGAVRLNASLSSAPPGGVANDAFADRIALAGTNVTVAGANIGATREPGEPRHNGNNQGRSVWWTWTAPKDGWFALTTAGSSFDTVLAVYTGAGVSALELVESNDDEEPLLTSRVVFRAHAGTAYAIAVEGFALTDTGSIHLRLTESEPLKAPAWRLRDVDGQWVSSTDFAGKVVILDFWATWCGPCVQEIPGFLSLDAKYRDQGLEIVGVAMDVEGASIVGPFLTQHGITYHTVISSAEVEAAYGGIQFLPTTFIIDREGVIVGRHIGYQDEREFEEEILPLLAAVPVPPNLAAARRGDGLLLSWPASGLPVTVERAETLDGPWSGIAPSLVTTNGLVEAALTTPDQGGFFRLRR